MYAPPLHTNRLLIRGFREDDALAYANIIFRNPNVMRYLAGGHPPDNALESAKRIIKERNNCWREDKAQKVWAIEEKSTQDFIGYIGLFPIQSHSVIEIAYALGEPHWGRGYATEAAREVLRYGFRVAALNKVIGLAYAENIASRNVLSRIGLKELGETNQYYNIKLVASELGREDYLTMFGQ